MSILAASLLALAVLAAQALHGGLFSPAFLAPSEGLLVLAAVPALWAVVRNRAPTGPFSLAATGIFVAYLVWRCVHAPDLYLGRVEMGQVLAAGLAFVIAYGGLIDTKARSVFFAIVLAGAFAQAVVGFFQYSQGGLPAPLGWFALELKTIYEGRFVNRAHGLYLNPNHYAWLMGWATLSCVALAAWARVHVITRVILVYLAMVFLAADMLSGSRGGLLSLLAGGSALALISLVGVMTMLRRGRLPLVSAAVFIVAICVGFGWFLYSSNWMVQGRMDAMTLPDVRALLLENAWRQFESTPLLGMGPGMFLYVARVYRTGDQPGDAIFAHDDWLQGIVEYGYVGFALALLTALILLGGGVGRFFSALRRRGDAGDRPLSNAAGFLLAALATAITFWVHSFTDFNLHIPANALLAGATLGILAGTGGISIPSRRPLPSIALRAFTAFGLVTLALAMALFGWRHAYADYEALRAQNANGQGNVREALSRAEEGLKLEPRDAALQAVRGRALYSFEEMTQWEAEKRHDSADGMATAEIPPEKRPAFYQGSADAFSSALAAQPMERAYHMELANALLEAGQPELARRHFIEAIRLDPGQAFAYAALADHFYESGEVERAIRLYTLVSMLPGGNRAGLRVQDLREEMAPPAPDASESSPAVEESDDEKGAGQ